jgi:hypothetical protein
MIQHNMIDGSIDVRNLKVGAKVADDEECVGTLTIAVIKCKDSDEIRPIPEFHLSRDFRFKDVILMIDKVRDRLARMEPSVTEHENLSSEIKEYLDKIDFTQRERETTSNSRHMRTAPLER